MEKIKIRGLIHFAGWSFLFWGLVVSGKGLYDFYIGEPEANLFSPNKWEFVSRQQWYTWSFFEIVYGVVCLMVCLLLIDAARRFPIYILRKNG